MTLNTDHSDLSLSTSSIQSNQQTQVPPVASVDINRGVASRARLPANRLQDNNVVTRGLAEEPDRVQSITTRLSHCLISHNMRDATHQEEPLSYFKQFAQKTDWGEARIGQPGVQKLKEIINEPLTLVWKPKRLALGKASSVASFRAERAEPAPLIVDRLQLMKGVMSELESEAIQVKKGLIIGSLVTYLSNPEGDFTKDRDMLLVVDKLPQQPFEREQLVRGAMAKVLLSVNPDILPEEWYGYQDLTDPDAKDTTPRILISLGQHNTDLTLATRANFAMLSQAKVINLKGGLTTGQLGHARFNYLADPKWVEESIGEGLIVGPEGWDALFPVVKALGRAAVFKDSTTAEHFYSTLLEDLCRSGNRSISYSLHEKVSRFSSHQLLTLLLDLPKRYDLSHLAAIDTEEVRRSVLSLTKKPELALSQFVLQLQRLTALNLDQQHSFEHPASLQPAVPGSSTEMRLMDAIVSTPFETLGEVLPLLPELLMLDLCTGHLSLDDAASKARVEGLPDRFQFCYPQANGEKLHFTVDLLLTGTPVDYLLSKSDDQLEQLFQWSQQLKLTKVTAMIKQATVIKSEPPIAHLAALRIEADTSDKTDEKSGSTDRPSKQKRKQGRKAVGVHHRHSMAQTNKAKATVQPPKTEEKQNPLCFDEVSLQKTVEYDWKGVPVNLSIQSTSSNEVMGEATFALKSFRSLGASLLKAPFTLNKDSEIAFDFNAVEWTVNNCLYKGGVDCIESRSGQVKQFKPIGKGELQLGRQQGLERLPSSTPVRVNGYFLSNGTVRVHSLFADHQIDTTAMTLEADWHALVQQPGQALFSGTQVISNQLNLQYEGTWVLHRSDQLLPESGKVVLLNSGVREHKGEESDVDLSLMLMSTSATGYMMTFSRSFTNGQMVLHVEKSPENLTIKKHFQVNLKDGSYITIIAPSYQSTEEQLLLQLCEQALVGEYLHQGVIHGSRQGFAHQLSMRLNEDDFTLTFWGDTIDIYQASLMVEQNRVVDYGMTLRQERWENYEVMGVEIEEGELCQIIQPFYNNDQHLFAKFWMKGVVELDAPNESDIHQVGLQFLPAVQNQEYAIESLDIETFSWTEMEMDFPFLELFITLEESGQVTVSSNQVAVEKEALTPAQRVMSMDVYSRNIEAFFCERGVTLYYILTTTENDRLSQRFIIDIGCHSTEKRGQNEKDGTRLNLTLPTQFQLMLHPNQRHSEMVDIPDDASTVTPPLFESEGGRQVPVNGPSTTEGFAPFANVTLHANASNQLNSVVVSTVDSTGISVRAMLSMKSRERAIVTVNRGDDDRGVKIKPINIMVDQLMTLSDLDYDVRLSESEYQLVKQVVAAIRTVVVYLEEVQPYERALNAFMAEDIVKKIPAIGL